MTEPIPEGCEGLIPHLCVKGAGEAIEFYKQAFGAEELHRMPGPDGRLMHAALRIGPATVFLADDYPEFCGGQERNPIALGNTPVAIHRYVEDCDAAMQQATRAGAEVTMPAQDMFWGDRYGQVKDRWGHTWSFATHLEDLTPEQIAAAGAKAFENF